MTDSAPLLARVRRAVARVRASVAPGSVRDALSTRRVRYGLVGVYAAYVLAASVVAPPSGGPGGGLPPRGPLGLVGVDKWLHLATYATLGFGAAYAPAARRGRALVAAALVATAFGAGVEVVQAPLAARTADLADAAANGVGATVGVGVWWLVGVGVGIAGDRLGDGD